jgi:hypothetical protein
MARKIINILIFVIFALSFNCANRTITKKSAAEYPFQEKILQYVLGDSIPQDGTYNYYWPKTNDPIYLGTTKNIDYLGMSLSKVRENRGTHCVGVSWQVAMTVLQDWARLQNSKGKIANLTVEDTRKLVDRWFIKLERGDDLASLSRPEEMGAAYALASFDLGKGIKFEQTRPGDFLQFWRRDNSGHSCIFLNWVRDDEDKIIGFHYWGSQPQTNGIGTFTEYFHANEVVEDLDRLVDVHRFYIGRLSPKSE